METLDITPERFRQALAWMNGQPSTLGEQEVLQLLRTLTGRFRENCRALRPGPVPVFRSLRLTPHPLSLSAIYAETQRRVAEEAAAPSAPREPGANPYLRELMDDGPSGQTPEQAVMRAVAEENRQDSVVLINAIAHVGASAGFPLTQSKAQLILYCLYGSRLGAGKERIPIEHPQMWRYGPVFPRAYKRGALDDGVACGEAFQLLLESDPVLLAAITRKTHSMMGTPMADLNAVHKGPESPYGITRARFPEKWGTQIPDEEIAEFFRRRAAG